MLTVTETAKEHLAELLKHHDVPDDVAVRFVAQGQRFSLQQDHERAGDKTYEYEGRTVLLLDTQIADLLIDDTLAFENDKLMLRHPEKDE